MRGAIRSRLPFLIALLAVIFISVPGFSGEHPWDSDGSKNGSTGGGSTGGSDDPSKGSTAIAASAECPGGSGDNLLISSRSTMSLVFRVSYYLTDRLYVGRYETGTKVRQAARSTGR